MSKIELQGFEIEVDRKPYHESKPQKTKFFLAKHPKKGDAKFLVKVYNSRERWEREKTILLDIKDNCSQKLRDRFVYPDAYGESHDPPLLYNIFPKLGVSLRQYFEKKTGLMNAKGVMNSDGINEIKAILAESIIPAISYLHDCQVVHGDICAENILQGSKGGSHWVLIDFASAVFIDDYAQAGKYSPPEFKMALNAMSRGDKIKPRATIAYDNFALGIMTTELILQFRDKFWETVSKDLHNPNIAITIPAKIPAYGWLKRGIEALLVKTPFERSRLENFVVSLEYNQSSISEIITKDLASKSTKKAEIMSKAIKYHEEALPSVRILVPEDELAIEISRDDLRSRVQSEDVLAQTLKKGGISEVPRNPILRFLYGVSANIKIGSGILVLIIISVIIVLVLTIGKPTNATDSKTSTQSTAISYQSVSFGSTVAGYQDGALSEAKFNAPGGIALDANSNMYISDSGNNVIRKIDSKFSTVSTIAGGTKTNLTDGVGTIASFNNPNGIAMSKKSEYLVVADVGNNAIRKIILSSGLVSTIGGNGKGSFNQPYGVTVDSFDTVYVADTFNNCIKKIDSNGGVSNYGDTSFKGPKGIATDSSGNVFVADTGSGAIKRIDTSGIVTTFFSSSSKVKRDGASLTAPIGLAVDANGNVYVVDQNNGVLFINATTKAISSFSKVSITAGATGAIGIALAPDGSVYVANPSSNNILAAIANTTTTSLSSSSSASSVASSVSSFYITTTSQNYIPVTSSSIASTSPAITPTTSLSTAAPNTVSSSLAVDALSSSHSVTSYTTTGIKTTTTTTTTTTTSKSSTVSTTTTYKASSRTSITSTSSSTTYSTDTPTSTSFTDTQDTATNEATLTASSSSATL